MGHDHAHPHTTNKQILWWSFIIITGYMLVEAIGGILTNSLALLADAGHMLSDAVSLAIALLAFQFGEKAATTTKTFGYKRFEILAAAFNGLTLIVIAVYILYEAVGRFNNPPDIATTGMLIISTIGLLVNLFVAWIMMRGDVKGNVNMRGAFLHVISDLLGSVGAIVAALCMIFFEWVWADAVASVIVAVLVLRSGFSITKTAAHILMEGTPHDIDMERIAALLVAHEAVEAVHDIHIWTITSGVHAMSGHIVVAPHLTVAQAERITEQLTHQLAHENISHVTLQFETAAHTHDTKLLCQLQPHEH
ncbi:cation diffusion facilitator family transporter [Caryophanon tenue]|uniref:Cation transporter n=1 Tax=Caryophanon tenue TaxID=33978 RepID=A0A1C0YDE7_9BACL|nr:cation diffusion facilitator family transporter [Caryophanon tenue]OCS85143.1 cation transporter [Caryophanon tenue]